MLQLPIKKVDGGVIYPVLFLTLYLGGLFVPRWHDVQQKHVDCLGSAIQFQFILQYITGFSLHTVNSDAAHITDPTVH